jgi:4-amino-4-deoxy-L-arabinose transferase-like glycosyltransferase
MVLLIVVALAPLWLTGILGRALWTPDEPREADIAWRMSLQTDRALPQLAGRPFLEKPPLTYWMSGAGIALFGDSAQAARAPNVLYALITALAIGALALQLLGEVPGATLGALIAASALTAYRASIWLAPDACLLAGCALALWGAWLGYQGRPGARKACGYTLMHLGAAIGFMAKSAPGWLVPALALLTLIVWERRWQELRRWELYVGLALQALLIGPWLLAVARSPDGGTALRTLFWNNLMGRFTQVAAPAALDYTRGHRNVPGKYLWELPLYLLPWTLIVVAALLRAWRAMRLPAPAGTSWRFALGASLPFLALLSIAATARDVYAAPALLGFALLTALWAHDGALSVTAFDAAAVRLTRVLVGVIAGALVAALLILAAAHAAAGQLSLMTAAAIVVWAWVSLARAARAQREETLAQSLLWTYSGYAGAFCLAALVALPVIDRWQDLPALAARIHADTAHESLALLDPDETTVAMLDRGLRTPFTILTSERAPPPRTVADWFASRGREARVLVLLPGHANGPLTEWLARWHPLPAPGEGVAEQLIRARVATPVARYELPQGRRYALLGPPP